MKTADVQIGQTYLTRVSGKSVRVVAIERVEPTKFSKTVHFRLRRIDNGEVLDESRAAIMLRAIAATNFADRVVAARRLEANGRWTKAADAWDALMKDASTDAKHRRFVARAAGYAAVARAKARVTS